MRVKIRYIVPDKIMFCHSCKLRCFQNFVFQILLGCVFLEMYCTHFVDELQQRNKLIDFAYFQNENDVIEASTYALRDKLRDKNGMSKDLFESGHIFHRENNNLRNVFATHPQNKIKQSNSGLIQTITMDLKPERDNLIPQKALQRSSDAGKRVMDGESQFPNSYFSTLPLVHHDRLVVSYDDKKKIFIDDYKSENIHYKWHQHERGKHTSGNSEDSWDRFQWQQILYGNTIGDRISMQYIL